MPNIFHVQGMSGWMPDFATEHLPGEMCEPTSKFISIIILKIFVPRDQHQHSGAFYSGCGCCCVAAVICC